jgi:hypothetical protein
MAKFNPILRKPGEIIKSEEWNKLQEDILADIEDLERRLTSMKEYVDNMEESTTMMDMNSLAGKSYDLDETIKGESSNYDASVVGLITKQWLIAKGEVGDICRFSIVARLSVLEYWSGAESGDKKALEVVFNYMDGTSAVIGDLFIHDRTKLRPKGNENPYLEYLLSPNELVWYRYRVINPNPEKEVLSVSFKKTIADCTPRIGNAIHYKSKITPSKTFPE